MIGLVGLEANAAPAHPDLTGQSLSAPTRVEGTKAPTSRLAKTDQKLLGRTDTALVPVTIKLDYDSIATYAGGVAGLQATSPSVTGRALTDKNADKTNAQRSYESYAATQEQNFTSTLVKQVPQSKIGRSLRLVYGGIAARVPANRIADIATMDNVVAVQADSLRQPLTDSSPRFLGAPTIYNQLGTTANAGQGVIFGDLDTGVWPEHPSFADQGNLPAPPGPARECNFGDNPLTPAADVFACQHKLIGGVASTETYDALNGDDTFAGTARDSNGHGTHTSSTAAGNIVNNVSVLGSPLAPIHGLAPGAYVMSYKVCGPAGCYGSDSAAAVAQAILDGVDVINFSIGGGTDPFTDPAELAFLDAYDAGVLVSASAGNDGPGAGTAEHLSPWVSTVAASTQTREFATTLTVTAGNGNVFTAVGSTITPGVQPALPLVMSGDAPYSRPLCDAPAAPGTFTGKIVACARGGNGRVEKGFNVKQGGAAGMVLYNPTLADTETDTHWLPAVHLADGTAFVAFMASHTGETATWAAGAPRNGQGDVMAAFSSRGPGGNFLKPDITAPGVQILAGDSPMSEGPVEGPPGEYYQAIAGTSMSSPHNAGSALLLKALHPSWTPGQIKSALMTTAITDVVKEDLTTPADPLDYGSGRINLRKAGDPGLTFDETAANMALLGNDPVNAVHLNLPSIYAPLMPGRLSTVRTAKNVTNQRQSYDVRTSAPAGARIKVLPSSFALNPGESVNLTVTIESGAPAAQYFGEVRLVPRRNSLPTLHLPVAYVTGQGDVSLVSNCALASIPQDSTTTCTVTAQNNSPADTTVDLTTTVNNKLKVVGASGAFIVDNHTVRKPNTPIAGAQPGVPSVDPGELFGYLPLDAFGITPQPIGDEEILNFTTPAFVFNGQTFNQVGVDSNGYLVAGGASSQDNNCCTLPAGPSPSRPNNLLAPFWTDLDGTGAPGILAGTLTDGVDSWLVFEYRVNVFGTTSGHVFEVWIGLGDTQDITFAYDPANLPADPGQDFLVGAENGAGEGDVTATLPTGDLRVTSTPALPGASVSYTLTVKGVNTGAGTVTSELETPAQPGTTVVTTAIQVTRHRGNAAS